MARLRSGQKAPSFRLLSQDGTLVSLRDFRGGKLLLYFYPKADTPGCTKQACCVRDATARLDDLGVKAAGISPDAPEAQMVFAQKHTLNFPLLSDSDCRIARAYGAYGRKSFFGRKRDGVVRSAFLIDEQQNIGQAWYHVKPDETAARVIEALSADTS